MRLTTLELFPKLPNASPRLKDGINNYVVQDSRVR